MKRALGLSVFLGLLACGAGARAQENRNSVALGSRAPAGCPSQDELRRAVEAHLGESLGVARAQSLSISAEVEVLAGRYVGRLRFESRSGVEERSLEHPDCGKLFDAAALVIAIAIDPERVSAHQAASALPVVPEPVVQAELPRPVVVTAPPEAPPLPAPTGALVPRRMSDFDDSRGAAAGAPFEFPLGVFALAGTGGLPGVGAGIGMNLALARAHFELGLVGRYWLPRSQPITGTEGGEILVGWLAAELRACGVPWLGTLRFRLCAAGGGGDIYGRGVGVSNRRTRHTAVPSLSASASLEYGRGGLSPFLGISGDWLLVQPRLGVAQGGDIIEVYKSSPFALSGLVGLSYRLGFSK